MPTLIFKRARREPIKQNGQAVMDKTMVAAMVVNDQVDMQTSGCLKGMLQIAATLVNYIGTKADLSTKEVLEDITSLIKSIESEDEPCNN